MEIDLLHLWQQMNPVVKGVVTVLTLQAVWCITVTIDRVLMLIMSKRKSRAFAKEVAGPMQEGDADAVLQIAEKAKKRSHLAQFIYEGVKVFKDHLALGLGRDKAAEFTKRSLERTGENLSANLNKGLSVLATTGSTAPFVGLLGTVFGILGAFKVIGQEGGGGLNTIGPLIGEALYVTGYGLMVAIPSVMLFNWLSGMIAKYEAGLANAGSELVDQLEAGALGATQSPAQFKGKPMKSEAATQPMMPMPAE
ncbi:MAG: MotA/TolQ/ExbB proton channel family protein [Polyangiales bacterium]